MPRVAYVSTIFSHKRNCEPLLYGNNCYGLLPTIVHPNELLDGAMINRNYEQMSNGETTYSIQNHAIIRELYARDGVDIDFVGVILENSSSNSVDKKRSALMTATLAKYFLNADLAILSKEGGGHPQLDMALCCDEMAKYGIKSAFIIVELMATDNSGDMESILFNTPNADVIISGGKYETLEFPKMDKIIGGEHVSCFKGDLTGPFKLPNRYIRGSLSQIGGSKVMSISY